VPSLPAKVTEQINSTPSPKAAPDADKAFDAKAPANSGKAAATIAVNKGTGTVTSKSEDEKKSDKTEKGANANKSSDNTRNDSKSAPAANSTNNDSGGGKNANPTGGTVLTAGQSLTSSESGEAKTSSEMPTDIAKEFANTPSPTGSSGASMSPLSESAGGGGCAVQ
jgi:hypothetical protein